MKGLEFVPFDYLLYLPVGQDPGFPAAAAFCCTSFEYASRLVAFRILELETTSVETQSHVKFLRWDIAPPEQVERKLRFCEISMSVYMASDRIVAVPYAVQAISRLAINIRALEAFL